MLPNGLRLHLAHDPAASRAAAWLRVAAGSHDEPSAHPGLAHFLEHLSFLGGAAFPGDERLMPWLQVRGGQVNASTRGRTTDYFFEVTAEHLGAGLARLIDMLARPLLDIDAQRREREVLEAEYLARSADEQTLIDAALATEVARTPGLMRTDCSMSAVHLYLADHKATTINRVVDAAKAFRSEYPMSGISIRLASGNAGVLAAINEEVEKSETPMLLYVYAAIALLVFVVYRDLRAVLVCCLPLTIGTFIGYWFMKELQIGLTIATLPVMVLAVGIGVDYAFYIYNRLQLHLAHGQTITKAVEYALLEVGVATIFTAITLAVGVATWAFSELKFQADMGKLLAFMFVVNMVMAMTVLPAFAVWLERAFPRKRPVRMIGALVH